MVRHTFYHIIFWMALLGALSSCKRPNETGVSTVSFQLPTAATVVQAHHAAMSQSVSNWNAELTPTNINEINCYVVMVETPEVGTPNICYDSSKNPLFGFHLAVGGVAASGQTLQIEVPTGTKRRFLIIGLKADSSLLATGCHDFKTLGLDKSLFSQPLLIGNKTADVLDDHLDLNVDTSLTNAKTVNNCTGFVDLTPAPSLAISNLAVTPAGPSKNVHPDITGNVTGAFPIHLSLHASPGCADSVYTTTADLAAGPSFDLSLAPSLSASSTYNFYIKATDAAGSSSCGGPVSYVFDNIAPALTISGATVTAATPPTFSGTCETGLNVAVSGGDTGTFACPAGSWSFTVGSKATDATYNYTFMQTDAAGNIASQVASWTRNTAAPAFTITSATAFNSASPPTFSGTCTNGISIDISGADNASTSCSSSAWSYTVASKSDGNYSYTFSQTSGGTTSASGTWTRDTTPPSATSFSITEGGSVTAPLIHLNFQAVDAIQVAAYCVRAVTTPPAFSDSCWTPLPTPGPNPNVTNEPYLLPVVPGVSDLFLFLADSGGSISTLSASGFGTSGIDKTTVSYNPDPVPTVSKLLVSNSDSMYAATPELTIPSGNPLYIRWNATGPIAANGITLAYTTDDVSWNVLTTGLANGSNSCAPNGPGTADDDATGCYVGVSPTSSFFRIKIEATTSTGVKGGMYSPSLNALDYREWAGRPGGGLGFDGSLLTVNTVPFGGFQTDNDALAVDSAGTIYVRDQNLGIIKIDPVTRASSVFIKTTGSSTGDTGPASSATLKHPYKIGVDGQDNLYILDETRIRIVTKADGHINTLIGGGADTSLALKPALSLQIQFNSLIYPMSDSYIQAMPFIVLRNGDLIFEDQYRNAYSASTQNYFWYYDHTTATVTPRTLSGTGYVGNAGENIALCNAYRLAANYNPVTGTITNYIGTLSQSGSACTSATDAVRLNASYTSTTPIPPTFPGGGNSSYFNLITGLDGKIYGLHGIYGTIYRFDSSANTWTALAGSGSLGSCIDGTSALSCSLTPTNVAVNKQGQVYFVDGGKVRMLYSDGTIRTVYGYGAATGDGGPGLLAQFGVLSDLGFWYNGSRKVVLYDKSNSNLREVNLAADNVTKIAGNGTTAPANSGSPALTTGLGIINWEKTFAINPSTGDVFWKNSSGGGQLVRLDRGTGNWVSVVGGGATDYFTSADDFAGSAVYFNYGYYQPIFYANGFLWAHVSNSAHQNVAVKAYDSTMSYTQSNYLSLSGSYSSSCPSVQTSCGTMFPANGSLRVSYDSLSASLLFAINGSNTIKYGNAGNILTFTITNNPISAFAYRNNGNDFIYYCSSSGALFKRDVTGSSEVPISLPTNVKCASTKMEVDSGSNVLYFVSEKNGIYGLASVPL